LAERDEPTVLHTHFTSFDLPAIWAALGLANAIVIWHIHSRLESDLRSKLRNALKFAVAGRRVEAILCVSSDLRDSMRGRLAPDRRLVVFPNAIDLDHFARATAQERSAARAELGIPMDRALLVHFGWHWQTKGGDLFVRTIAELSRAGVEVAGICVGGGDPARAASARSGVEDRVLVTPPRDDVRPLYAAADVFVSSSRAEGAMPFAALEALATGTPVVASAIPNHVLLAECTKGCALAEGDPQALAQAVRSVLRARSAGRFPVDISEIAYRIDLSNWAERLLALYAERS
jgi:glycosyltransferase involved in cell wall biosynthesis